VNGTAEAYCILQHGARISFGGKSVLKLVSLQRQQKTKRLLIRIASIIGIIALLALGAWFVYVANDYLKLF
jgi:hypothetical protein